MKETARGSGNTLKNGLQWHTFSRSVGLQRRPCHATYKLLRNGENYLVMIKKYLGSE